MKRGEQRGPQKMIRTLQKESSARVCADEICTDRASLSDLIGKYDVANIKLDKVGGHSETTFRVVKLKGLDMEL